jgi:hypothetical protein
MADTLTKKKTPAKPKKTATKKETVAPQVAPKVTPAMPSREEIEELAKRYWAERNYQDGFAEQDWLRAEQELLKAS